jgi:hypothetical protein
LLPRHFLAVALHAPRNRGAYRQSKGSCTQSEPLTVTQDKPFIVAQPEPFKVELTIKVQQPFPGVAGGLAGVIRREVTVFSTVRQGPGTVTAGWKYQDGSGGKPVHQLLRDTERRSLKQDGSDCG